MLFVTQGKIFLQRLIEFPNLALPRSLNMKTITFALSDENNYFIVKGCVGGGDGEVELKANSFLKHT